MPHAHDGFGEGIYVSRGRLLDRQADGAPGEPAPAERLLPYRPWVLPAKMTV
jgi:hypothetical protein